MDQTLIYLNQKIAAGVADDDDKKRYEELINPKPKHLPKAEEKKEEDSGSNESKDAADTAGMDKEVSSKGEGNYAGNHSGNRNRS